MSKRANALMAEARAIGPRYLDTGFAEPPPIERSLRLGPDALWELVDLAEQHLRAGRLKAALNAVERCDRRDKGRRNKWDGGLRIWPDYRRLAVVAFEAGDPAYAHQLIYDICVYGGRARIEDIVWSGGYAAPKPEAMILAARAYANFGERDAAEALATAVWESGAIREQLSFQDDSHGELVVTWIEIDRKRSIDRALVCARAISDGDMRAHALAQIARYAYRVDDLGHEPVADDAPQPPPRLALLDGEGNLLPKPRRMKPPSKRKKPARSARARSRR